VKAETFKRGSEVRVVFHPEPQDSVIQGNWGVRVEVGPIQI